MGADDPVIVATCTHPQCFNELPCQEHKSKPSNSNADKSLYGYKWQQERKRFMRDHPLCEGECQRDGIVTPGFAVDHIIPHRGDLALFWDRSNWRTLCESEHNSKSRRGE